MNILITGSDGYIGSAILETFSDKFKFVRVNRNFPLSYVDYKFLKQNKVAFIINLATLMQRDFSHYNFKSDYHKTNFVDQISLINAANKYKIPIFYISTKDIYSKKKINKVYKDYSQAPLIDEDEDLNPLTPYSKSKLMAEFLYEHCDKYLIIRLNSIYTDLYHPNHNWIGGLVNKIINNMDIELTNDGYTYRDPLFYKDLVRFILIAYENSYFNKVVNLGGGSLNIINMNEIIILIKDYLKKNYPDILKNNTSNILYIQNSDFGFAFSNKKVITDLQFQPKFLIRDVINDVIDNFIKHNIL